MEKLVLIDGNRLMNRAFYGIMGSKMLTTKDGKYTNAIYGFLAILFRLLEDIEPKYLVVSFDLKKPTARHKLYEGYKANRKEVPYELKQQFDFIIFAFAQNGAGKFNFFHRQLLLVDFFFCFFSMIFTIHGIFIALF